jgi:hypothetical protein
MLSKVQAAVIEDNPICRLTILRPYMAFTCPNLAIFNGGAVEEHEREMGRTLFTAFTVPTGRKGRSPCRPSMLMEHDPTPDAFWPPGRSPSGAGATPSTPDSGEEDGGSGHAMLPQSLAPGRRNAEANAEADAMASQVIGEAVKELLATRRAIEVRTWSERQARSGDH